MIKTAMDAEQSKVCAACGQVADSIKLCTGCRLVHYCGRECQLAHRKSHKKLCSEEQKRRLKNEVAESTGLKDDELDKPVVVFFVERFVSSLMMPLLGSPSPTMWDVLFEKKGARERVNEHMLSFTIKYLSSHAEYGSPAAVRRLLEADYHRDIDNEPILGAMQKELYRYLKEVEHFL